MLKVLGAVSVMFFLPLVFDLLLDNDAWLITLLHSNHVLFLLNIERNYVEGSLTENSGLTPYYVTGLVDAEGCYSITIVEGKYSKPQVTLSFRVSQKSHSQGVLRDLIKFFDAGVVSKPSKRNQVAEYSVRKFDDILLKVIPHFEAFPLVTSKLLATAILICASVAIFTQVDELLYSLIPILSYPNADRIKK